MKKFVLLTALLVLVGSAGAQMVVATIEVGNSPYALVYDSVHNKVFAALQGLNRVAVIDPVENELVTTIPTGQQPTALALSPVSNRLYVGNDELNGPGTVTVINTADNSVTTTLNVGDAPLAMAWNSTRNKVYVMNRNSPSVSVIDCAAERVTTTISLSQTLNSIVYNPVNDRIYVSSGAFQRPGVVHIINCANDQATGSFNSGSNAGAMAVNPVNNRLYIANIASSNLQVMNCVNHTSLATLRTGDSPQGIIWTPDNRIFVTSYWGSKLHAMYGDSLRFFRETNLTGNPEAMLYNSRTEKLFVAKPLQSQVAVVDARIGHEGRIIDEINVGSGPRAFAFYPAEDHIYVGNAWGRTVTVLKDVIGVAERPDRGDFGAAFRPAPNPAPAGARLSFGPAGRVPGEVRFWNAAGKLVPTGDGPTPVAPDRPGVYFFRVVDAGRAATGKLVVR
ncbi:MAG TPA: YncE family protein [candidate division WOR-3 bacterium]|uniref:YncE family protein n=1 Tax=candidate division WOR-3 bacterium TaxID=2052148 RepID=A0A7V0T7C9_UNCW3|nr:YncE family protein [candidate division WOR-3 bacterium]